MSFNHHDFQVTEGAVLTFISYCLGAIFTFIEVLVGPNGFHPVILQSLQIIAWITGTLVGCITLYKFYKEQREAYKQKKKKKDGKKQSN